MDKGLWTYTTFRKNLECWDLSKLNLNTALAQLRLQGRVLHFLPFTVLFFVMNFSFGVVI